MICLLVQTLRQFQRAWSDGGMRCTECPLLLKNASLELKVLLAMLSSLPTICDIVVENCSVTEIIRGQKINFVINVLLSLTVKEFQKSASIWRSYEQPCDGTFQLIVAYSLLFEPPCTTMQHTKVNCDRTHR